MKLILNITPDQAKQFFAYVQLPIPDEAEIIEKLDGKEIVLEEEHLAAGVHLGMIGIAVGQHWNEKTEADENTN